MTTWTSISNAAVAVGGIPSSTTVTALRDNPSAVAESSSGAPVMVSGWHPVDKVSIGDGKTGLIYDFAVTGTIASVVTPDFVDGYEYRIVAESITGTLTANFLFDLFGQTGATYTNVYNINGSLISDVFCFQADILMPRVNRTLHAGPAYGSRTGAFNTIPYWQATFSPEQKILRARIDLSAGSIDGGKVWLFRRREYASLP